MLPATTVTTEDQSNLGDEWNTLGKKPISPVKSVNAQANLALARQDMDATWDERPEGGNGESLRKLTEFRQDRQSIVRGREWPGVRRERPETPTFHALQEWEGYVVSINETAFIARLVDLTDGRSFEEEEAEFPLEEISESDAAKMKLGSIFRWVIGYSRRAMGQKERVSSIVFRDPPAVSRSDRQAGEAWAETIQSSFQE